MEEGSQIRFMGERRLPRVAPRLLVTSASETPAVFQDLALCPHLDPVRNLGREVRKRGPLGWLGFMDNKMMREKSTCSESGCRRRARYRCRWGTCPVDRSKVLPLLAQLSPGEQDHLPR